VDYDRGSGAEIQAELVRTARFASDPASGTIHTDHLMQGTNALDVDVVWAMRRQIGAFGAERPDPGAPAESPIEVTIDEARWGARRQPGTRPASSARTWTRSPGRGGRWPPRGSPPFAEVRLGRSTARSRSPAAGRWPPYPAGRRGRDARHSGRAAACRSWR
jgi:hypothetical protein